MPNMDSTQVITPSPSAAHYPALLNLRVLQQRSNTLLQQASHPRRTEVAELLHRHYEDKSLIDQWASWCYDLSFWQKSSIFTSVISIAGLAGSVLGLAFPFIALASSILYATYTILNDQEKHRRERGVRLVAETTALTEQLDRMMVQFRLIAAEMTTALEKVQVQAVEMLEQNAVISERTSEHLEEQTKLQEIITVVSEQSERTQKVQSDVIAVVENMASGLHLIRPEIDEATRSIHSFKESIDQFAETTELMHHTETKFAAIATGLHHCVKRISTARPQQTTLSDSEVDKAVLSTQNALADALAAYEERQKNNKPSTLILSM